MTVVRDYRAILADLEDEAYRWNATLDRGFPAIVTYSFYETPELPARGDTAYFVDTVQTFSEAQRDAFRAALEVYAGVTGLLFVETTGDAMIHPYGVTGSHWGGWAYYPYVTDYRAESSDVILDLTDGDRISGYDFEIILHEIGHALGLSHPHEGKFQLAEELDDTLTTVMSYNWAPVPNVTLSEMDKTALQLLYGAPQETADWDYGFDDDVFWLTAADGNDRLLGVVGRNRLSGGAGDDKLVGRTDDDTLAGDAGKDRLFGDIGADRLDGGDGDDLLFGGHGDDILTGGAGDDRLNGGQGSDELSGGDGKDILLAGKPRFTDLDILRGEAGDDILKGNSAKNTLDGGSGDDQLFGRRGDDSLDGGEGDDDLIGGGGRDRLSGGDGADVLNGGKGVDVLTGGAGRDLFVFDGTGGRGRDRITDFELGVDQLTRPAPEVGPDDIDLYRRGGGADTVLKVDGDGGFRVYFEGITKSDLAAALDDGFFF